MNVRVKVCGITSLVDAEKALEFGADMLGFNFYPPSPRCISPEAARSILEKLPRNCFNVALFVNEEREKVTATLECGALGDRQMYSAVQFHGEETAEYCRGWELKVIKAVRMKSRESLSVITAIPADYYLLDSWSAGYGGSGTGFPWQWLDGQDAGKLILSGGLNVDNVVEAVRQVRPFAVDVCSGVESSPGKKDHEKLKEFILAAKGA
ncbi:MAG: phosphoribosylanthranilate isomerase [Deltaproteobacteria bacterium]|nr:phosphoribosylanthranilate isomerase [Deltaproteobacteria bacterium]